MNTPNIPSQTRPSAWRTTGIALVLIGGGFALGAASLAFAHGDMPGPGGWHHHGPKIGAIQHMVRGALDNVGASTVQEDKIHDIIAATYTDFQKDEGGREAMRKQVLELMKAPTIDRAAVEKLRAEKIAAFDAKSKTIVGAFLDAAGQLTPDQRAKLVQHVEDRMADHAGWGGWHHGGPMDEQGGHHGSDSPDHDSPDHG